MGRAESNEAKGSSGRERGWLCKRRDRRAREWEEPRATKRKAAVAESEDGFASGEIGERVKGKSREQRSERQQWPRARMALQAASTAHARSTRSRKRGGCGAVYWGRVALLWPA